MPEERRQNLAEGGHITIKGNRQKNSQMIKVHFTMVVKVMMMIMTATGLQSVDSLQILDSLQIDCRFTLKCVRDMTRTYSDDDNDDENYNENMEKVICRCSSKSLFLKFCKFHKKTPVLEFLFNKVAIF